MFEAWGHDLKASVTEPGQLAVQCGEPPAATGGDKAG